MQVNHSLRRIASLSAFVLAISITSASQAGVIPWVYDAIFGPVRYRSYGDSPYAVSYARPVVIRSYAPASYDAYAPASGCSTSYYAPMVYSMSNSGCGSCGPVVMAPSSAACGTMTYASTQGCSSGCSVLSEPATLKLAAPAVKKQWKAPETAPSTPAVVTPSAGTSTDDGLGTSPRSRGKAAVEPEPRELLNDNRPANDDPEPTILKRNKTPAKTSDPEFEPPLENIKPKENKNPNELELELDTEKKAPGEAKILLPLPNLNLDAKIAWRTEPQRARVPFHAKLARASVTRRTTGADSGWTPVVAKVTGTQVAKK